MKKKVTLLSSVIIIFGFLIVLIINTVQINNQYINDYSQRMSSVLSTLSVLDKDVEKDPQNIADQIGKKLIEDNDEMRLSVIAPDGMVVGDSEKSEISENHSTRPEIIQAQNTGKGFAQRISKTTGRQYYYEAVILSNRYILRAALPTESLNNAISHLWITVLLSTIIGIIIVCTGTWIVMSKAILPLNHLMTATKKIADGDFSSRVNIKNKDEVGALAVSFNKMAESTQKSINELSHNQNRLKSLLEGLADGVLAIDKNNKVLFFNEKAVNLLDNPNISIGRDLDGGLLVNRIGNIMHKAMEDSKEPIREEINVTHNRIFKLYVACADDDLTVLAVISDITKMKKLEKLRSEFVSNVTHELKTPLTSIKGSIELLKSGERDKETRDYFYDVMDIEAERLQNLIDDMLELSKIENAHSDKSACPCLVEPVISDVIKQLQVSAKKNDISITYEIEKNLTVVCTPSRLRQLIFNLTQNAVKYNKPKGKIHITGYTSHDMIIIKVSDTGIGIESKHIPRLFERFYRVDFSRSQEIGGTGLGLSIVKHLAMLYGGDVGVESTYGEGSTFIIRLPCAK